MSIENLIPPALDGERAQNRKERIWRWSVGVAVGTTVAILGYLLTGDWEWFLAVPVFAVVVAWSKLHFSATWFGNSKNSQAAREDSS
jgi:hypothetical protein